MSIFRCRTIAASVLAVACAAAWANEGLLDSAFATGGLARISFDDPSGTKADHARYLVMQPNGMALVLGSMATETQANVALARIRTNGTPDPAFNGDGDSDGKVVVGFIGTLDPRGMALLSDGRIVVAGKSAGMALLTRRAANGGDTDKFPGASFGSFIAFAIPGASATEFVGLLGLPGGKFLAVGTFSTLAGGEDFFVARFTSDGVLDTGFGAQPGYTRIGFDLDSSKSDQAAALALAPDGRIAVVGTVSESDNEYGIAMLQSGGAPDDSFDGDGKAVVNFDIGLTSNDRATAACFAPDGTLLVAGNVSDSVLDSVVGLILLSKTGSLVSGFENNGRRRFDIFDNTGAAGVACTYDGKFLLTGTFDTTASDLTPSEAFVTRFLSDGSSDFTFGSFFATTIFGLNRPNTTAPTGRIDRGVAIAQSSGLIYALFDVEYQSPDYDFGLARMAIDHIFDDDFEQVE